MTLKQLENEIRYGGSQSQIVKEFKMWSNTGFKNAISYQDLIPIYYTYLREQKINEILND